MSDAFPSENTTHGPRCGYCGSTRMKLSWQTFSNDTTHIRADCADCEHYVTYVPQTPENLTTVGQRPVKVDPPTLW